MPFFSSFASKFLVSWIYFSSGQRNKTIGPSNSLDHHVIWNAQHPTEDYTGDINYIGLKLISLIIFLLFFSFNKLKSSAITYGYLALLLETNGMLADPIYK